MTGLSVTCANFGFLAKRDVQLVRLGALAERYFGDDPNTALKKSTLSPPERISFSTDWISRLSQGPFEGS